MLKLICSPCTRWALQFQGICSICKKSFASTTHNPHNLTNIYPELPFENKYSEKDRTRILQILNEYSPADLTRFELSKICIRKLDSWRKKRGEFKMLSDVLNVDDVGVIVLERLCDSILNSSTENSKVITNRVGKSKAHLVKPALNEMRAEKIHSVTGIHLGINTIGWAKIERVGNCLVNWNLYDCSFQSKQTNIADTFQLGLSMLKYIPPSDAYVFESKPHISPSTTNPVVFSSYIKRNETTSVLATLLNTSQQHNPDYDKLFQDQVDRNETETFERVYFLKTSLPARLFRRFVGGECVSIRDTVIGIMQNSSDIKHFTPVDVNKHFRRDYITKERVNQEILGHALLLTAAFFDLCIYKNAASYRALSRPSGGKLDR